MAPSLRCGASVTRRGQVGPLGVGGILRNMRWVAHDDATVLSVQTAPVLSIMKPRQKLGTVHALTRFTAVMLPFLRFSNEPGKNCVCMVEYTNTSINSINTYDTIARPPFFFFFFLSVLAVRHGKRTNQRTNERTDGPMDRPVGSREHPTGDLRRPEAIFRRPPGLPCFVPGLSVASSWLTQSVNNRDTYIAVVVFDVWF